MQYGDEEKMEKPFEEQFASQPIKTEGGDGVMNGNLILVGNPVPQEQSLVINVHSNSEMPMM